MASWLGGLGSGLGQVGGSLSSFTGQISNFTKDMLLEGVEEVGDAATELQVSNSRLAELEAALATQKSEYDRLRKLHAELEERHEASEIQIKGQSVDYRTLLQQKDVEISHLKARQSGFQEQVQKLQQSAQSASGGTALLPVTTASSTATSSSASTFMSRPSGSHQGFHGDDMDLSDIIWSEQEINRLSTEVLRLEGEVAHWRRLSQISSAAGTGNGDQSEFLILQRTIKDQREEMSREVDEHQHEMAALQDAQRQKMADITRRHRLDLEEYEERIEELEEQILNAAGQATSPSDASKMPELQQTVNFLQEAADQREKQVAELSTMLEEAQRKEASLQLEKDGALEENAGLLQNYTRLQASVTELQERVHEQEEKALQKGQLEHEIQVLRQTLAASEREIERLNNLTTAEPKEEVEHADILELNTIIGTLIQEKEVVEQEKLNVQERLMLAEEQMFSIEADESELLEHLKTELERRETALRNTEEERDTLMSELEELDRQNQEATQHMISVKEQLTGQLKKAEEELINLTAELNTTKARNKALTQDLDNQKETMSQSAFTINDLHMSKQQLQGSVNELKSKLGSALEQNREARKEISEQKKTLREREEQLSATKGKLDQAACSGPEAQGFGEKLSVKERELSDLRKELNEMRSSQEKAMSEDYELKMENRRLKVESEQALGKGEELTKQLKEGQAVLNRKVLEKDTRIEALKLEKSQIDGELRQTENTLTEQAKQYQQTIEELTRARSMDASALQMEHERAIKLIQEKDMELAQLRRDMQQLASDHSDTNEMLSITVAGQKQLTDLLQEKDVFVETLKQNASILQTDMENSIAVRTNEAKVLNQTLEEKDKQLGAMKEENSHLKEKIDRFRDQQSRPQSLSEPRTLDIITELETEITQLKSSRNGLEEEAQALRGTMEEQQASLLLSRQSLQTQQSELEQAHARLQQTTLNYDRLIHAREEEISHLRKMLDQLSEIQGCADSVPMQGEVILLEEKTQSLNQESGNEKHDLSKVEIEKLVRGIKEKETEISQLNENNLSLTRQLDQLVVSRDEVGRLSQMILQKDLEIQALHARLTMGGGGGHNQDVLFLQQQLQAYAVEREQVLAVLNEKTRENSQLRSDHHRLMDIMAGKEAALVKLQQELQRLSNMSDPSGSQEMFKETIQNLSRIIREKDIEIDALTQKCQTLVAVLQSSGGEPGASSGGVSSNQFEELLQERDTLKQQVKKMEEWKQQVITTVKNMQHESAQLQEELLKLQGEVSVDSDCSSKLTVDYTRLVQSYEQKERRLGRLSQELAQVQQTITQLSTTKEVLLGKLDSVAQTPDITQSSEPPVTMNTYSHQTSPGVNNENLQEELGRLRTQLAEKENIIRTIQENNYRLSNSASASESEKRSQAEEFRQIKERLESLQRSMREKDLLIRTKGEKLNTVSEALRNRENDNEVLKQAVTNLKERALILEMDGKKLKEDNELIVTRCREKESEFRALQETNMQVSLLLREKEFELSAVSEKAATVEKMLKDREQGKSGELNQLLNEIKSMQEKAVAFQQERDQVMMALKQKQMETTAVQSELQHTKDKEQRLNLELQRLRNHLLEIEDSYTREAVAAEDRESELRRRVALLDAKVATSSNAVENASQQASMQVESLQEQLSGVVKQRDEALTHLRTSQEQVNQYAVSLSNLQMVLEQFQQEEKAMYSTELERLMKEKEEWRKKALRLQDQASALQINLDEANTALDSASRLTDQLDLKDEQIEELKKQVHLSQEVLEDTQRKLMNLLNSTEGKIDKVLMHNLFLGYFHTPKTRRADVLRLMGGVVGLNREEVDKMLEEDGRQGVTGWVSTWLGGRVVQSVPNTPQKPTSGQGFNSSFSELFVKFLEIESTPSLPAPKLPIHDIKPLNAPLPRRTGTASSTSTGPFAANKRADKSNPFLAPRSTAVPLLAGSSSGGSGGHLLMKPISDALPTFTPVPVSAEASAGAVLKELLKQ